ncbi:MAG: hypothetical protein CL935_04925 [Deltaproteobacteria bacterium]|nr:hypothetical protein [Deltaproteobacteria bacterium]|tara:strand:- start:1695 stop:2579 length:885 start_codon:yes stop_codon:yes gene_type:complete
MLKALEERLQKFVLEQETKKTWDGWLQWIAEIDCPITFKKPAQIPNRPFSFQTWLASCENQLREHPEWQTRLTTPAWLKRQQINVLPNYVKTGEKKALGAAELQALQAELTRMVDQIHTVQQRISNIETGASKTSAQSFNQIASEQIPSMTSPSSTLSATGLSDPLGRPDLARTLEREMQMANKSSASSGNDGDLVEPDIIPLKEAYLTYNNWCDQFDNVHLDLQEFVNGELRVKGSHKISFKQFKHRILKNARDGEQLEGVFESFSRLRSSGVDINLSEIKQEINESESNPSP